MVSLELQITTTKIVKMDPFLNYAKICFRAHGQNFFMDDFLDVRRQFFLNSIVKWFTW